MSRMIRSLATLLILLVTATTAWGAGEREVTIAQGIDAEFLDVQMTNNVATIIINGSIYDTLLTRDKQLQIVPHLATSYKLVSDKVWEVKLRQGVKFHNGEAFDATAVKFSAERIQRPDFKSPQKGWFSTIEQVGDRRSLHGALPHQGARSRHALPHDAHVPDAAEVHRPGGRRAGQPEARGHRRVQVRGVAEERAHRRRGQRRPLDR